MKILVISDIHGNAEALRAVVKAEPDADHTIFLGDALLSGPQAAEVAELLDKLNLDIPIMGNHDEELLDPSRFAHWPKEWVALNEWIIETLDPAIIQSFADYQPNGHYELGGLEMYLHHGELPRGEPQALPDAKDEVFLRLINDQPAPTVLFGHTHVQFERQVGEQRFINPGSVGQPRCGRLHACYGVFEDGLYTPKQVDYDPRPWLAALDRIDVLSQFPDFKQWLADGLTTGFGIGERAPWTTFAAQGFK